MLFKNLNCQKRLSPASVAKREKKSCTPPGELDADSTIDMFEKLETPTSSVSSPHFCPMSYVRKK